MEKIQEYFQRKKELNDLILIFLNNSDSENYDNLVSFINANNNLKSKEELDHFLELIINLANNHYHCPGFYSKLEQIVLYLKDDINQHMSNLEIFSKFESNKRMLLFLINSGIINFDENIANLIKGKIEPNGIHFSEFFIPEMNEYQASQGNQSNETSSNLTEYSNNLEEYEEKRKQGENDSYICSLIRKDSVIEFITFVNQTNLSLSTTIQPSVFETNSFLNERHTSLIEYAAFFGSIQIFQYLCMNGVELNSSLWIYAVHSNDPNFFHHYIEEQNVPCDDKTYETCLYESIKCHHNEFANYIQTNKLKTIFEKKVFQAGFQFSNYSFFTNNFYQNDTFFNLCQYNYITVINLLLESRRSFIEHEIIYIV